MVALRTLSQTERTAAIKAQQRRIYGHLDDVTAEQVSACRRDGDGWLVTGSKGNEEYRVTWTCDEGYQCSCKSGQYGWWNVKHPSGCCWHVRAAVVFDLEEERARLAPVAVAPAKPAKVRRSAPRVALVAQLQVKAGTKVRKQRNVSRLSLTCQQNDSKMTQNCPVAAHKASMAA